MHEWSLAEQIRTMVLNEALARKLSKVERITLEIGTLTCVEPEALQWALQHCLSETLAEQADIVLDRVTGQVTCQQCHTEFETEVLWTPCPHCQGYGFQINRGDDMILKSFEGV